MNSGKKLKIAWFSELFAADSLSAYFSRLVLPHLKDKFQITLFHNSFETYEDFETHHYLKAFELDNDSAFDLFFYQLEDDSRLNFVRSHIGIKPGITYFHHFNFSNYGPEPLLNSAYTDVVSKFNSKSAVWPDRAKKYKPKGPAAYREGALSPVAIFSTPHSLDEYKRQITLKLKSHSEVGLNAFYLPYPINIDINSKASTDNVFKIAFAGSTRIENRAHKVLSAVSNLKIRSKLYWLVPESEISEAKNLLEEYQITNAEIINNYNPESWGKIVSVADCALHTLFSVYGHNEPYLGMSMAYGLPCIVTNFASTEYMPENIVIKIQPGNSEAIELSQVLSAISENQISLNRDLISNYIKENNNARQIAAELTSIFTKRKAYLQDIRREWEQMAAEAKRCLVKENYSLLNNSGAIAANMIEPVFEEMGWLK